MADGRIVGNIWNAITRLPMDLLPMDATWVVASRYVPNIGNAVTPFAFSGWIGLLNTWQGENDGYSWKKLTPFDEILR